MLFFYSEYILIFIIKEFMFVLNEYKIVFRRLDIVLESFFFDTRFGSFVVFISFRVCWRRWEFRVRRS